VILTTTLLATFLDFPPLVKTSTKGIATAKASNELTFKSEIIFNLINELSIAKNTKARVSQY
jgi:hypothetical protein